MKAKIRYEYIEKFAVSWILLTSGSMVFNICNMLLSMIILLAVAIAILYYRKSVTKQNFYIFIGLTCFTLVSAAYNGMDTVGGNDLVILLIRLFSLCVIMSNVDYKVFKNVYIDTIFIIALISLPCFFLKLAVPSFEFPFTIWDYEHHFHGTFYYTLGSIRKPVFNRNCGVFWESGLFQIYLNYALAILALDPDRKHDDKHYSMKFIIMSIAVITTVSTMGYLCYFIVIAAVLLQRNSGKSSKKTSIVIIAIVALIALLIVESTTHIIEGKLIDRGMSFGSRYDDTIISLKIALHNPIFGTGPVNEHVSIFESYMLMLDALRESSGVLSRSNGFGLFLMKCGFPITVLFSIAIYRRNRYMLQTSTINSLLVFIILLCGLFNEPIAFTTLWLSFFMKWKAPDNGISWK